MIGWTVGGGAPRKTASPRRGPINSHKTGVSVKITVQSVAPSDQGILLGLRIEHEKAGWIRFGCSLIVMEDLTAAERAMFVDRLNKAHLKVLDDEVEDEPLW